MTSISYAFRDCSSLTKVNIPKNVSELNGTFCGCSSLASIVIPESVTSIGEEAFRECTSLSSIIIPEGVTYIGEAAFQDCSKLEEIFVLPQKCPKLDLFFYNTYYQFSGNSANRKIYVSPNMVDIYKTTEGWSIYADDIVGYDFENNKVIE